MKNTKQFLCSIALAMFFFAGFAQDSKSLMNLNLGVGGNLSGNAIATPSFNASYEYFTSNSFSIGILAGYSTIVEPEEFGLEEEKTGGITVGALANFYLSNSEKFDFYIGTVLGYDGHKYAYSDGGLLFEFHAGARYNISKSMSINSELGFGLALLKLGISFNL